MKLLAREVDLAKCPPDIVRSGHHQAHNIRLTTGRHYDVHALMSDNEGVAVLIVDDIGYPLWYPAWFFENFEMQVPSDWICRIDRDQPWMVIGPRFIAENYEAFRAMTELEKIPVALFWERVERMERERDASKD